MRYLVDTQILIWSIVSPDKLSNRTKDILQNNEILISHVSLFEIAIKQKIGKLSDLNL
jgi:PIN domain nuclease of toxin-antitoxin system